MYSGHSGDAIPVCVGMNKNWEKTGLCSQGSGRWNNTTTRKENTNAVSNIFRYLFMDSLGPVW